MKPSPFPPSVTAGGNRTANPGDRPLLGQDAPPSRELIRLGLGLLGVGTFHLAHNGPSEMAGLVIALVPFGLLPLADLGTPRRTFYASLLAGMACVGPQLGFFWGIFGPAAVLLWAILALWTAIALTLMREVRGRWGPVAAIGWAPVVWLGCEFFRSELYHLRFSWLNSGFALPLTHGPGLLPWLGVYGVGACFWLAAAITWWGTSRSTRACGPGLTLLLLALHCLAPIPIAEPVPDADASLQSPPATHAHGPSVVVAGAQVESLPPSELVPTLDRLLTLHPDTELVVLPEYSLGGEPGDDLKTWCRQHARHLVVGGRSPRPGGGYYNTAFVINPTGSIVFQQAKSVPIQFFDDGVPAETQSLWQSPWGPLGLAVCYDLSYTKVIDHLVRLGAVGLIIPTMDAIHWGEHQHRLHARVAPARAAEHRIPIVRVASSGISQCVDATGRVTSSAPTSEDVVFLAGRLRLRGPGHLPADRLAGPIATTATFLLVPALAWSSRRQRRNPPETAPKKPSLSQTP